MDTKKFITGTLVGGVAYFFLGFLFYVVLFEGFFQSNMGSATGVQKTDDMVWWALILGNLASAALLSFIFLKLGRDQIIRGRCHHSFFIWLII